MSYSSWVFQVNMLLGSWNKATVTDDYPGLWQAWYDGVTPLEFAVGVV